MKQKMLPEGEGAAQAPLRPPLSGSWEGSWRLLGPSWGPLGASWASSGLPGELPEVPGSLREVIFGAFFGGRRRDPEIYDFMFFDDCLSFFHSIFEVFFDHRLSSLRQSRRKRAP